MFVIIDVGAERFTFGETLDKALKTWHGVYEEYPDVTTCIIVQGKRKKAEIVLTDYPEPKKPASSK